MNKKIKKILNELYKIDSDLKKHEADLAELIAVMLKNKPEPVVDEKFIVELRQKLQTKARKMQQPEDKQSIITMKNLIFACGGATLGAVLMFTIFVPWNSGPSGPGMDINQTRIEKGADETFGALSFQAPQLIETEGRGAGAGGYASNKMETAVDSVVRIAPMPSQYKYVFKGELELTEGEAPVYKYLLEGFEESGLASTLQNIDLGLIDLKKFKNIGLQNLTLYEDKEFGHMLNIDLERGVANINENWRTWPQSDLKTHCFGVEETRCSEQSMLTLADVPSDEKLFQIAKNFADEYGIDLKYYGAPIVRNEWKRHYSRMGGNAPDYVPESMQVTFPLMVEGHEVYDQSGYPVGLNMNINIRHEKVSSVYDLRSQKYLASDYPLINDNDKIIEMAEKGGMRQTFSETEEDVEEIVLGTPLRALIKTYNYSEGMSEELLVPGLLFPVEQSPDDYFGSRFVTVLLVEGMGEEPILLREPAIASEPLLEKSEINNQ